MGLLVQYVDLLMGARDLLKGHVSSGQSTFPMAFLYRSPPLHYPRLPSTLTSTTLSYNTPHLTCYTTWL